MKKNMQRMAFSFDIENVKRLKALAAHFNTTQSQVLQDAIKHYEKNLPNNIQQAIESLINYNELEQEL